MPSRIRAPLLIGLLLLAACLAGCQRAHPFDWRVDAATPGAHRRWMEEAKQRLPPEMYEELNYTTRHLFARVAGPRASTAEQMRNRNDPRCRQIHRRTVREVLIMGYEAANESLHNRYTMDANNLLRLVQSDQASLLGTAEVERRRTLLDEVRQAMERNSARVAELRAGTARLH